MPGKPLLVLDINGLLCYKVKQPYMKPDDGNFLDRKFYRVYRRPGVEEFLEWCLKNYDVAMWSSTTTYNAQPILKWLFPLRGTLKPVKFSWYRDRTNLDPDYNIDNRVQNHDTVKNLVNIWSDPYVNDSRRYNKFNTLIVDDSVRKTRFNNEDNVLIVDKYSPIACEASEENTSWVELLQDRIVEKFDTLKLSSCL